MVSKGDVRRLFLQSILSRGILSEKLAKALWVACIDAVKAADENLDIAQGNSAWDEFLKEINKDLNDLDFVFKRVEDQITGKQMVAFINVKDDEISQLATSFVPAEIAFFKAIVEQIMLAPHESYSVSSLAAMREISEIKPKINMTKSQAEIVLASFVSRGWLLKSSLGRYMLSTRTIIELETYLKTEYPDEILECDNCQQIVTTGLGCPGDNCSVRIHLHCFRAIRRRSGACAKCKAKWPEKPEKPMHPVGEAAVREKDNGKRRVRARGRDDTDNSDEDMEEQPSQGSPDPTPPKRTQRSRKGKSQVVDDDEEDD